MTVELTITTRQNTIAAGNDTLKDIEFLEGSGFGDTLNGNPAQTSDGPAFAAVYAMQARRVQMNVSGAQSIAA